MVAKLKFRPSDFSRWGTCTASPAATAGIKSERKSYADEGIIAHELHALCLSLSIDPRSMIGEAIEVPSIGPSAITAEMAEAVDESLQYVADRVSSEWVKHVEVRVDLGWLIDGQSGVGDVIAFPQGDDKVTELHVLDFKYGKGVKVFAEENGELMLHALGAMRTLLDYSQMADLQKVVLHIMQPRIGHFDRWEIEKGQLERFAVDVRGKYLVAKSGNGEFVPSVEGCRFCPIKADCRTLRDSVFAKILDDPNGIGMELKDPARIPTEELAEMHEWLDFISAWAGNVKEYMREQALKNGVVYPGLKLIAGKGGARNWKDEQKAIEHMQSLGMAEFEIYEQSLISPSKFEKQVGRKNTGEGFKDLVSQKTGSPQLVSESQPGVPYENASLNEFD